VHELGKRGAQPFDPARSWAVMVDGKRITAVSDPRSGGAAGAY